jgi:hypothetical protein
MSLFALLGGNMLLLSYWPEDKQWRSIWKMKAPGKMIIHLWRFVQNCLPSGGFLCFAEGWRVLIMPCFPVNLQEWFGGRSSNTTIYG